MTIFIARTRVVKGLGGSNECYLGGKPGIGETTWAPKGKEYLGRLVEIVTNSVQRGGRIFGARAENAEGRMEVLLDNTELIHGASERATAKRLLYQGIDGKCASLE